MILQHLKTGLFSLGVMGSATVLQAAENGGSAYPDGTESFMGGVMPPPGMYLLSYNQANSGSGDYWVILKPIPSVLIHKFVISLLMALPLQPNIKRIQDQK